MVSLRAVIPAAVVACCVLLAGSLYVHGDRELYHALLEGWGAFPFCTPFLDMHAVTSAVECHRLGFDVFVQNPCDVLKRVHAYSPLWLRLAVFPITSAWENALGLGTVAAFLLALPFLPPSRGWWETAVITLGSISSVVAFALERANIDLLVFLLTMVAVALTRRSWQLRMPGYAVAVLAGMLKFYPVTLLILAVRERLAVCAAIGAVSLGTIGVWFAVDGREILRGMANIPTTSYFDDNVFGMRNLPFGLAQIFGLSHLEAEALLIALLVAMFAGAVRLARWDDLALRLRCLTEAEATYLLVGCVLMVGCFLAAQNGLYRAIHFLFVLPALTAMARTGSGRDFNVWLFSTIGLIMLLMWSSAIRMLIEAVLAQFGVSTQPTGMAHFDIWLVRELMWWVVVALLTSLLMRLIWESRAGQDAARLFPGTHARRDVIRPVSHSG